MHLFCFAPAAPHRPQTGPTPHPLLRRDAGQSGEPMDGCARWSGIPALLLNASQPIPSPLLRNECRSPTGGAFGRARLRRCTSATALGGPARSSERGGSVPPRRTIDLHAFGLRAFWAARVRTQPGCSGFDRGHRCGSDFEHMEAAGHARRVHEGSREPSDVPSQRGGEMVEGTE